MAMYNSNHDYSDPPRPKHSSDVRLRRDPRKVSRADWITLVNAALAQQAAQRPPAASARP